MFHNEPYETLDPPLSWIANCWKKFTDQDIEYLGISALGSQQYLTFACRCRSWPRPIDLTHPCLHAHQYEPWTACVSGNRSSRDSRLRHLTILRVSKVVAIDSFCINTCTMKNYSLTIWSTERAMSYFIPSVPPPLSLVLIACYSF